MPTTSNKTGQKEKEKNPAAVALGRLGGLKGGPATARKLSAAERRKNARNAVNARWAKFRSKNSIVH